MLLTTTPPAGLRPAAALLALVLFACSEAPDETPLGREAAALLARPEQVVPKVKLQHILLAFVGAMRGSESGHTEEEARTLTSVVLARARAGEDFTALMKQYTGDEGPGTYVLTQDDREGYAKYFGDVGFRLQVGEIGVAPYHRVKSPFGWHVIKRLE
jgi:parvulin-like peptidyl-prolyl isomerase